MSYSINVNTNNKFRAVCSPAKKINSPEDFIIDVQIYGGFPPELQTSHYDKSLNYVAFVAFSDNYSNCTVSWNLEPKNAEHYNFLFDYIETNKKEIIDTAIKAFKERYPTFQPNKAWL